MSINGSSFSLGPGGLCYVEWKGKQEKEQCKPLSERQKRKKAPAFVNAVLFSQRMSFWIGERGPAGDIARGGGQLSAKAYACLRMLYDPGSRLRKYQGLCSTQVLPCVDLFTEHPPKNVAPNPINLLYPPPFCHSYPPYNSLGGGVAATVTFYFTQWIFRFTWDFWACPWQHR